MPSKWHEKTIELYASNGWSRTGFAQAVIQAVRDDATDEDGEVEEDTEDLIASLGSIQWPVPDAYRIHPEERVVEALEVTDTNFKRFQKHEDLSWLLDEVYWSLRVVEVTRRGVTQSDPWMESLAFLQEEATGDLPVIWQATPGGGV